MGKPKKLKSSIKALQEVLTSIRPAVGAPLCMQPAKTNSFRDVLTSFNSIYYVPPTATSSSASLWGEEEAISTSTAATSTSTCSSCLSSTSYAVADASPDHILAEEAFPNVILSSERFFFSPFTSKSIMGESFLEIGDATVKRSSADLCKESIPMAMASRDPYRDFRTSMEEMVELLHCYLRLNEKKTHRFIVLAFMDLSPIGPQRASLTHSPRRCSFLLHPFPPLISTSTNQSSSPSLVFFLHHKSLFSLLSVKA
ncbi:unnamed protein product [Spirodela intermedia]|uniref:Transcription repressor n=1 Tax=Spirodela intermedia TaxID=51605 RepID=A0A7I8IGS4_SPIIN|nr:unnamed protein product [Spirodela intermedia]CAA6657093.1 unnamed protein product [Spirodela intermedia]